MRHLIFLYQQFLTETNTLLDQFSSPLPQDNQFKDSCDITHKAAQEMCVIRLYDSWSRFCRELVIMSACCEPIRANGRRIPLATDMRLDDRQRTIQLLEQRANRREWTIGWGIARYCIDAAVKLKVNNQNDIANSIGSTPSPADDLRVVRNFFAHRNIYTAREVRLIANRLNLPTNTRAAQVVNYRPNQTISLFETWIFGLRIIAYAAIA